MSRQGRLPVSVGMEVMRWQVHRYCPDYLRDRHGVVRVEVEAQTAASLGGPAHP
jgi:hypothetical protein